MQRTFDIIAVSISSLCVVHCLLTPLALILFPVLAGTVFAGEEFHLMLLWGILPASGIALFLGCRQHKDKRVIVMGLIGLLLLLVAAFAGHDWLGEWGGKADDHHRCHHHGWRACSQLPFVPE